MILHHGFVDGLKSKECVTVDLLQLYYPWKYVDIYLRRTEP